MDRRPTTTPPTTADGTNLMIVLALSGLLLFGGFMLTAFGIMAFTV